MYDDDAVKKVADSLRQALDSNKLPANRTELALTCLRRLENTLRITIFGTDARHCVALLNIMAGRVIVPRSPENIRIQAVHSTKQYVTAKFKDGSQKTFDGAESEKVFEQDPMRVRVADDLPALKKVTITLITDTSTAELARSSENVLLASDMVLWAGDSLNDDMIGLWSQLPERLNNSSYTALSPRMDFESWAIIEDKLAGSIQIDARLALAAKSNSNGVDKDAFRAAGGMDLVRAVKTEIENSTKSAVDAAQLILAEIGTVSRVVSKRPASKPAPRKPNVTKQPAKAASQDSNADLREAEAKSKNDAAARVDDEFSFEDVKRRASQSLASAEDRAEPTPAKERVRSRRFSQRPTAEAVAKMKRETSRAAKPVEAAPVAKVEAPKKEAKVAKPKDEIGDQHPRAKRPSRPISKRRAISGKLDQKASEEAKLAQKKVAEKKAAEKPDTSSGDEKKATPWSLGL